MALVRRALRSLRSLFEPPIERVPRWWLHCPICDAELVGPYPAGASLPIGQGVSRMDPSRDELIGKCPVHGLMPYNDASARSPVKRRPME